MTLRQIRGPLLFAGFFYFIASIAIADIFDPQSLVETDLVRLQANEIRTSSPKAVAQMNDETIRLVEPSGRGFNKQRYTSGPKRARAVDHNFADLLRRSVTNHPVVSYFSDRVYQRENVEIGFCFGRAAYVHIALLKLGIAKESIKKVWLIGPMNANGIIWDSHVATAVRGTSGEWFVIDDYFSEVHTVREWFSEFHKQNKPGDLRIYITDPEKFTASLGSYDRIQLGLDLDRKQDWYQHYFKDLMKWFGSKASKEFFVKEGLFDARRNL